MFGLFLVATIAGGLVMFMQDFNWWFPAACGRGDAALLLISVQMR